MNASSLEVGSIYYFNRARAIVLAIADGWVTWIDDDVRRAKHRVPEWYFEKYAARVDLSDDL